MKNVLDWIAIIILVITLLAICVLVYFIGMIIIPELWKWVLSFDKIPTPLYFAAAVLAVAWALGRISDILNRRQS